GGLAAAAGNEVANDDDRVVDPAAAAQAATVEPAARAYGAVIYAGQQARRKRDAGAGEPPCGRLFHGSAPCPVGARLTREAAWHMAPGGSCRPQCCSRALVPVRCVTRLRA